MPEVVANVPKRRCLSLAAKTGKAVPLSSRSRGCHAAKAATPSMAPCKSARTTHTALATNSVVVHEAEASTVEDAAGFLQFAYKRKSEEALLGNTAIMESVLDAHKAGAGHAEAQHTIVVTENCFRDVGMHELKRSTSFEFELPYSKYWKEAFDDKLEQMQMEIDTANLPQRAISAAGLTITDATGMKIVVPVNEMEQEGIRKDDFFSDSHLPVSAHFPLLVKFGKMQRNPTSAKLPLINPGRLLEEFIKNILRKPVRLGGPVSLARVEEIYEILVEGSDMDIEVQFVPSAGFVDRSDRCYECDCSPRS